MQGTKTLDGARRISYAICKPVTESELRSGLYEARHIEAKFSGTKRLCADVHLAASHIRLHLVLHWRRHVLSRFCSMRHNLRTMLLHLRLIPSSSGVVVDFYQCRLNRDR